MAILNKKQKLALRGLLDVTEKIFFKEEKLNDEEVDTVFKEMEKAFKFNKNKTIKCSFCQKAKEECTKLFTTDNKVYICDKCINLSRELIDKAGQEDDMIIILEN